MSGLRIFKNDWLHLACDAFNCNQTPTGWAIGVPDGPMGMHQRFCDADMQELIANLPDELLPAVGALVIKHVKAETEFGLAIWQQFRALPEGSQPVGATTSRLTDEQQTATLAAISGGVGAAPDPAAQLAGIEALVLDHVTNGTEWGQALVSKIADALPDEVAPDGIPDALTPPVPDAQGAPTITEGDGGEPPVNPEAEYKCPCGWEPKAGSTNPEANLKAHQRFCEVVKAQKGEA